MKRSAIMMITACILSGNALAQVDKQFAQDKIKVPELREVTEWINSKPLTFEKLKGKVVVVHFLTYG